METHNGVMGVFTTSTCEKATESIELEERNETVRKAVILCRVIAGRIHNNAGSLKDEQVYESGFDSLDSSGNFEELYILKAK